MAQPASAVLQALVLLLGLIRGSNAEWPNRGGQCARSGHDASLGGICEPAADEKSALIVRNKSSFLH